MTVKRMFILSTLPAVICLAGCYNTIISVPDSPYVISDDAFLIDTIATGFTIPYGIAIIADNEYYITDRIGKMFHWKDGILTEITGIPKVVTFGTPGLAAIMHGGLMDLSLHPDYAHNGWLYMAYLQ